MKKNYLFSEIQGGNNFDSGNPFIFTVVTYERHRPEQNRNSPISLLTDHKFIRNSYEKYASTYVTSNNFALISEVMIWGSEFNLNREQIEHKHETLTKELRKRISEEFHRGKSFLLQLYCPLKENNIHVLRNYNIDGRIYLSFFIYAKATLSNAD